MAIPHVLYVLGGAVVSGLVGSVGGNGSCHRGAVKVASAGMRVTDKVARVVQDIADEASDVNAEARRQARIEAVVAERLAELEPEIRAEAEAKVDAADIDDADAE